jgi:hypothetical protein
LSAWRASEVPKVDESEALERVSVDWASDAPLGKTVARSGSGGSGNGVGGAW